MSRASTSELPPAARDDHGNRGIGLPLSETGAPANADRTAKLSASFIDNMMHVDRPNRDEVGSFPTRSPIHTAGQVAPAIPYPFPHRINATARTLR